MEDIERTDKQRTEIERPENQISSSLINQKYLSIFLPLFLFIGIHVLTIVLLLLYIQFKFKDIHSLWFFNGQKVPYETFFDFTVNHIAEMNRLDCETGEINQYCHPNTDSTISNQAKTNALKNKGDVYGINQGLTDYIIENIHNADPSVDIPFKKASKPIHTNTINPKNEKIAEKKTADKPKNASKSSPNTNQYYILSYFIHLGKIIRTKIPFPWNITVYSIYILFWIFLTVFILFNAYTVFQPMTNTRFITLWEDRPDFIFFAFILFYIVIILIVYIILKYTASMKNPVQHPFITTFWNPSNFANFKEYQLKQISEIRSNSEYALESFEPDISKEGFSNDETNYEDIREKLIRIQQARPERKVGGILEYINTMIAEGIDSIQKNIRVFILKTYLSKENTIKIVAPI